MRRINLYYYQLRIRFFVLLFAYNRNAEFNQFRWLRANFYWIFAKLYAHRYLTQIRVSSSNKMLIFDSDRGGIKQTGIALCNYIKCSFLGTE